MKRDFSIIIAGSGPGFGSGHAGRMRELRRLMTEHQMPAELFLLEGNPDSPGELRVHGSSENTSTLARESLPLEDWIAKLKVEGWGESRQRSPLILDARDLDPAIFPRPLIALDNRCPRREELLRESGIYFHDTLPHPGAELEAVLRNSLISADIIAARRSVGVPTNGGRALVYAGSGGRAEQLDPILESLVRRGDFREVIRVGGPRPSGGTIQYARRLDGAEYARALQSSDAVFSYFGMTILEAWYLGKRPVLYSIDSAVHEELSRDLARRTGLAYLDARRPDEWRPERWDVPLNGPGPGGDGYRILRELVAALNRGENPA